MLFIEDQDHNLINLDNITAIKCFYEAFPNYSSHTENLIIGGTWKIEAYAKNQTHLIATAFDYEYGNLQTLQKRSEIIKANIKKEIEPIFEKIKEIIKSEHKIIVLKGE